MMIQLKMGPEFQKTLAELRGIGPAVAGATSRGLTKGAKYAAGNVIAKYLSGQSLKTRSKKLKENVEGWLESPFEAVIGVRKNTPVEKYKWILGDEEHWIKPVRAQALTIPIGEALQPTGVPKWKSVKDAERALNADIFRIKNVLGYKRGKRGKFRPLFVLVKSVLVQGSGALADGVLDSVDDMTAAIRDEVDKVVDSG